MSSPDPRAHDRSDKDYGVKPNPKHKALQTKKGRTLKDLKQMIAQPASKHWFKRYGNNSTSEKRG